MIILLGAWCAQKNLIPKTSDAWMCSERFETWRLQGQSKAQTHAKRILFKATRLLSYKRIYIFSCLQTWFLGIWSNEVVAFLMVNNFYIDDLQSETPVGRDTKRCCRFAGNGKKQPTRENEKKWLQDDGNHDDLEIFLAFLWMHESKNMAFPEHPEPLFELMRISTKCNSSFVVFQIKKKMISQAQKNSKKKEIFAHDQTSKRLITRENLFFPFFISISK